MILIPIACFIFGGAVVYLYFAYKEREQQIEKMKCCGNCDWSNYLPNGNCLDCDGKKNWKLKEIKENE